ncbi:MAG: DUF4097 family beta strand repeat protein [Bacteroidales bacterium]|nr:DUF4097 family beta strand repeat protein [Bacteroidales bacterium]
MQTLKFSLLAVLFVAFTGLVQAQDKFEKKYHEAYEVTKGETFEISNKFGDINIENTTADKITIDAVVIVKARSKEKADKIIESIKITISKSGSIVKAETDMEDLKMNNVDLEINYTVTMPAYLNTNLINKYGNVTINELHGKSNLAVKYGSLNVNKILDGNEKPLSSVELGYCEHSTINEFNWGKVVIKYSKLKVGGGQALVVSSKYSKLDLGNFSSIVAEAGYDNYNVGEIKNLVLTAKYTDVEIAKLTKKLQLENKYGDVSVETIPDGFSSIDVVSKYAQIKLGLAENANYNLDIKTSYADVKYNSLNITNRVKEGSGMELIGTAGSKSTDATITIRSEYGDVDLRP